MNGAPSTLVSPGLWGFAAFFGLAIALWLLMRNMNARMRRMSYEARRRQAELEATIRGDGGDDASGGEGTDGEEADREGPSDDADGSSGGPGAGNTSGAGGEDDPETREREA